MEQLTSVCEMLCQIIQKKQEEKRIEEEQATKAQNSKIPIYCDDDDDYSAITPSEPFAGKLTLLKSIPPEIDETDCYHEEDIRFSKKLLYDNSSPRPPKEFVYDNSDAEIESFSPSPIPVEDSD
nr:hypothetical protein [Tanacetum cinerariifolium]